MVEAERPRKIININFVRDCTLRRALDAHFFSQNLSRGIQFSRANLNGALTKHKNKDIKTLNLEN